MFRIPRVGCGPFATVEEAKTGRPNGGPCPGWNLRCNRCGLYGALWYSGERPGWGSLALCDPHADELYAEHQRHREALAELRAVNYEQERQI